MKTIIMALIGLALISTSQVSMANTTSLGKIATHLNKESRMASRDIQWIVREAVNYQKPSQLLIYRKIDGLKDLNRVKIYFQPIIRIIKLLICQ